MRLIDADKLETEIEELIRVRYEWISDSRAERRGLDIALCTVEDAPTVDAVPVVRCKNCRFYLQSSEKCELVDTRFRFYETDKTWTGDCFCSWGERRDEDANSN